MTRPVDAPELDAAEGSRNPSGVVHVSALP